MFFDHIKTGLITYYLWSEKEKLLKGTILATM